MKRFHRNALWTAAIVAGFAASMSSASAGDTAVLLDSVKDSNGNEIQNDHAFKPVRVSESEVQNRMTKGATLLIHEGLERADGQKRRTTSFLGALYAPYADVTLRFNTSTDVEVDDFELPDFEDIKYTRTDGTDIYFEKEWFKKIECEKKSCDKNEGKSNNGHGNNADGVDVSNPGQGKGGPNGAVDESGDVDDEVKGGGSSSSKNKDCDKNSSSSSKSCDKEYTVSIDWERVDNCLMKQVLPFVESKVNEHRQAKLRGERKDEAMSSFPRIIFGSGEKCRLVCPRGAHISKASNSNNIKSLMAHWNSQYGKPADDHFMTDEVREKINARFDELTKVYWNFSQPNVSKKTETPYFMVPSSVMSNNSELNQAINEGSTEAYLEMSKHTVGQRDPSFFIRIGDVDGFGYGDGGGRLAVNKGLANPDGDAVIGTGDFMPNNDENRSMATGSRDDFDHRSYEELHGCAVVTHRCVDVATYGSHFTDIALSTSYDKSQGKNEVHVGVDSHYAKYKWRKNKKTYYNNPQWYKVGGANKRDAAQEYGKGGAFPKPPSKKRPNQPGFIFDFKTAADSIVRGQSLFFNMITADYDVTPFRLILTSRNGDTVEVPVVHQQNSAGEDGLVQAAFARLPFNFIFSPNNEGGFDGWLRVDMDAPNEPYLCYDFVELSTNAIDVEGEGEHLDIYGHVVYAKGADFDKEEDFDVTRHEGQLIETMTPRFVPQPKIDTEEAAGSPDYAAGEHTIDKTITVDNFKLAKGATVRVTGNVVINVFGDVDIPLGAKLVIEDNASVRLYADGAISIAGLVDNATPKNLRVISTLDSDATNKNIQLDVNGGYFIGSLVGKRLSIVATEEAKINFVYDKAMATEGISEEVKKLRVRALLNDRD